MVYFNAAGRLGNHHFMAANCIAYALRHGLEFSLPDKTTHDFWSPLYLKHLINPKFNIYGPTIRIDEKHFHYEALPFDESWRDMNICMTGYFQSEKFFSDYKDEVIKLFNYPYKLIPDVCSVQARFGDYLTVKGKHIIVDEGYLMAAMALIYTCTGIFRFKVFSDDIPYFKKEFGHLHPFEYSTNRTIEEDLVEISCCHSNINSSSTFAWWGAYLNRNPDKIVVTQEKWFQDGWKDEYGRLVDTKDIIPDSWIKI